MASVVEFWCPDRSLLKNSPMLAVSGAAVGATQLGQENFEVVC